MRRAASLLLEGAIKDREYPPPPYLYVAADLALLQAKFAASRGYLERACPRLLDPTPGFDDFGFCNASAYAFVLQRLGDRERAERVLYAYLKYIVDRTRLGVKGFGIADVEALALLGRSDEALARLREAIDAGWRTSWPRHGWNLADDPYLTGLRDDARFRAMVAETDADIARMRERAAQAEASGDWQPLLALAAHGEGRVAPAANN